VAYKAFENTEVDVFDGDVGLAVESHLLRADALEFLAGLPESV